MSVEDVGADMPCSAAAYLASNEDECFNLAVAEAAHKPISLAKLVSKLMDPGGLDESLLGQMRSVLNLFILVLG